ncbi:MAG: pyridoxal-phosphate dependent enzyme [Candidatus Hodarchaeota archaeon]
MKYIMKCMNCDTVLTDDEAALTCPNCDKQLSINIIHNKVGKIDFDFFKERTENMWKFFPFLPLKHEHNIISLGEGATPLLKSNHLGDEAGVKNLLMKNETANPTGSFMDRQISMGISVAKEMGYSNAVSLSTGNAGASVAAYSARAGFKNLILVPKKFQKERINQIKLFGGNAIQIDSESEPFLMDVVIKASGAFKAINLATTSLFNAFTNHGAKTIIYEMFEQMNLELPELIVVPVGGSGLICSLIQACMELKELGLIGEIPYFLAVQPYGCHPFINALQRNSSPDEVYADPWININTSISALAKNIPFDYSWFYFLMNEMKEKEKKVFGITVTDEETREAQKQLSKKEGLFVQLASSTPIAALKKLEEIPGDLQQLDSHAVILTATGRLNLAQAIESLDTLIHVYPESVLRSEWKSTIKPFFES